MSEVAGIDLGTTYSVLARVNEHGLPEVIPNAEGFNITPSVVFFEEDSVVVGTIAKEALKSDPGSVVQLAKRHMGSAWMFDVHGTEYRPEQISALVLRKLVKDAETVIGPIQQAVITVPAYFNDGMRNATKLAGEMAGLEVLALINEPTAAAIAFGLQGHVEDATIVVCDLGGGTFDVTVMDISTGELVVRATGGDNFLGGANFDKKLYDHFVAQFHQQFGINLHDPDHVDLTELARTAQEWFQRAEQLKRDLTLRSRASTSLTAAGKTMRVEVTRDEYQRMSRVLLQEVGDKIRETLRDAGLEAQHTDMVLLVGGSTRMPMIRELVAEIFGKAPNISIHPDEAVALGAALYSANRAINQGKVLHMPEHRRRQLEDIQITDVASHSIGIEAYDRPPEKGGKLHHTIILRRNTALPTSGNHSFYTVNWGQTSIRIRVLEGEDADLSLSHNIGEFHITDLPDGRPAGMPLEITMQYNRDGILEVEAVDQQSGRRATATIDRSNSMSDQEEESARALVKELVVE